jgi:multidrug efflux system outer membrane protein
MAKLKLFNLKFQHGQISKMNVEQVKVQYETAAAQIPIIEQQIVQLENALSVLLGRNPGPIPRGNTILTLTLPRCLPGSRRNCCSVGPICCRPSSS